MRSLTARIGAAPVALSSESWPAITLDVSMMKLLLVQTAWRFLDPAGYSVGSHRAWNSRIYVCTSPYAVARRMARAPGGPYTRVGAAPMEGLHTHQ